MYSKYPYDIVSHRHFMRDRFPILRLCPPPRFFSRILYSRMLFDELIFDARFTQRLFRIIYNISTICFLRFIPYYTFLPQDRKVKAYEKGNEERMKEMEKGPSVGPTPQNLNFFFVIRGRA